MSDVRDDFSSSPDPVVLERLQDIGIDTSKPHPARIYDYLLGGRNNFQADRDAAEKVALAVPTARAEVVANRQFLSRVVTYAAEQGITQFLDIGTGVPTAGPTHEVARAVNPDARVVYVDNDPIVLAHSRALLSRHDLTVTIQADVREPDTILDNPKVREMLDFDQPIALMFVGLLYFIDDADDPWSLAARYRDALAPESHLLLSHAVDTPETRAAAETYEKASARLSPRTPERIEALFEGFTLVEPGLVPVHEWHPNGDEAPASHLLGGVGRLLGGVGRL